MVRYVSEPVFFHGMIGLKHKKPSMCHLSFVMHNKEFYVFEPLSLFCALDRIVYVIKVHFYRNTLQVKWISITFCMLLAIFSIHVKFDM